MRVVDAYYYTQQVLFDTRPPEALRQIAVYTKDPSHSLLL